MKNSISGLISIQNIAQKNSDLPLSANFLSAKGGEERELPHTRAS
jgi:hypothetical protein